MKDIISDIAVIVNKQTGSMEELYREILDGKTYIVFLITDWRDNKLFLKVNIDDKKFIIKRIDREIFDMEILLDMLFYLVNTANFKWTTEENKW